ncbi:hypothetical protein OC842_006419 [Tilletia horrida]|uniref:DDT domain-containing protein n=1 Tax=Tilletia horrida TaxID=155126 RepID=A0AAN6JHP7_9BASI|nr:hypothetical protein OC842_006419 [Tilletia horrida]
MVLLRRKQVELVKPPALVDGQDPDVFYLAATGEIFLDYESYTTRLSFYNQRLFQCELTGRIGLTFFEALLSENQELARLVRDFPDPLKGPVLKSANFAIVGRLDQLVDNIFERYHNRFFPGDEVSLEIEGDKYHAEVKEVYPPRSVWRIHQEEIVETKLREYEARRSVSNSPVKPKQRSPAKAGTSKAAQADDSDSELSDLTEPPPASQEFLAGVAEAAALSLTAADVAHKIGGDLSVPTEKVLKLDPPEDYLYRLQLQPGSNPIKGESDSPNLDRRHHDNNGEGSSSGAAKAVSYSASTYEARASALSRDRLKFSKTILKKLLREAMRREAHVGAPWTVRENWASVYNINTIPSEAVAKKNEEIREAKLQKRKKVVEEPVVEPPKKKKASQAELKRQAAEEARLAKEKEEEEKRLKAERKKALKYPAEDLELDPINARELSAHVPGEVPRQKKRPACKRELPSGFSGRLWEDLLAVYGYLQAVGKPLQLSPFTLDDFEAALRHSTHEPQCTLIVEIHAAVLNAVIRDGNFSKELAPAALSVVAPQAGSAAAAAAAFNAEAVGQNPRVVSLKGGPGPKTDDSDSRASSVNGRASRAGSEAAAPSPARSGRGRNVGAKKEVQPKMNAGDEENDEEEEEEEEEEKDELEDEMPQASTSLKSAAAKLERASAAELAVLNGADTTRGGRKSGASVVAGTNGHGIDANGSLSAVDASFTSGLGGGGDILDISPEELVLSHALHAGRGWEKRILKYDEGRRGWELALIGCLAKRATVHSVPRLWAILSQLTGTDHPDGRTGPRGTFIAETFPDEATRYPHLSLADKVAALQFVCELSMMTKYVRSYFEECENTLTELRKERAEISRARKQVDEERRDLAIRELTRGDATEGTDDLKMDEEAGSAATPSDVAILKEPRAKSSTPASDEEHDMLDSNSDESGTEYSPGDNDDDAASSSTSETNPKAKRPRLASRQETLRKQAMEREAAEAAKEAERARLAQARKDKNAETRQLAAEKKRLEEEHFKVTKREEAWEREFRRFQFGPRLKPLGYDRFYQRYWWFDGLGTAPLVNQAGNIVYSTGRIFVQGPSEDEWDFLLSEYPEAEVRTRAADELGENALLQGNEWGYYDEPETVETLFAWLRVRGVREDKFKKEFAKWRPYILGGMTRRNENLTSTTRTESAEGRRSVRSKTEASRQSHMAWTNKAALK